MSRGVDDQKSGYLNVESELFQYWTTKLYYCLSWEEACADVLGLGSLAENIPPASRSCTAVPRILSSSVVFPESTCPRTTTIGCRVGIGSPPSRVLKPERGVLGGKGA